jgi:restriction endonuclease S subunit
MKPLNYKWYRPISTKLCSKYGYLDKREYISSHDMRLAYKLPVSNGVSIMSSTNRYTFTYNDIEVSYIVHPIYIFGKKMDGVYIGVPSEKILTILNKDYLISLYADMICKGKGRDIVLIDRLPEDENTIARLCSTLKINEQSFLEHQSSTI